MVRKGSRVQVSKAAPHNLKGFIYPKPPSFAGGFLALSGVIYRRVDNSVGALNNYGLPVYER